MKKKICKMKDDSLYGIKNWTIITYIGKKEEKVCCFFYFTVYARGIETPPLLLFIITIFYVNFVCFLPIILGWYLCCLELLLFFFLSFSSSCSLFISFYHLIPNTSAFYKCFSFVFFSLTLCLTNGWNIT